MNQRLVWIVVTILALLLLVLLFWPRGERAGEGAETAGETPAEEAVAPGEEELVEVDLYFPGEGGQLYVERREMPARELPEERISAVVEGLLAGPRSTAGLRPPLPDGVQLRKVYLVADGTVYLDLESAEGAPPPSSGSRREMLTVYSLVNSVLRNVPESRRLALLWNGEQPASFAGHLDTTLPLVADDGLVASGPPR
jgi:hypothetical protein